MQFCFKLYNILMEDRNIQTEELRCFYLYITALLQMFLFLQQLGSVHWILRHSGSEALSLNSLIQQSIFCVLGIGITEINKK